ncbi:MAG: outer membrane beta-barrel protein [Chitinophagaceae bacterium]|nr:outer membrane beta-barrel protein [Chitinophagaceae bacterium]
MCSSSKAGVISILFSISVLFVQAQQRSYKWMVGINGGAMIYQGDLAPSTLGSYKTPSFTVGISAAKILNPYFAVRANAVVGKLRGDDAKYNSPVWRQYRNLNFSSPVTEFSVQLLWNPFGNNSNELGLRITPYLFGGAGVSFVNISRDYNKMDTTVFSFNSKQQVGLKQDTAKGLPRSLLVLPVGAGLSFYLSPRWSLNLETIFRYTFTDYLDGFSYVANPTQKDYYHTHTVGLVYRFGGKDRLDCPKF